MILPPSTSEINSSFIASGNAGTAVSTFDGFSQLQDLWSILYLHPHHSLIYCTRCLCPPRHLSLCISLPNNGQLVFLLIPFLTVTFIPPRQSSRLFLLYFPVTLNLSVKAGGDPRAGEFPCDGLTKRAHTRHPGSIQPGGMGREAKQGGLTPWAALCLQGTISLEINPVFTFSLISGSSQCGQHPKHMGLSPSSGPESAGGSPKPSPPSPKDIPDR